MRGAGHSGAVPTRRLIRGRWPITTAAILVSLLSPLSARAQERAAPARQSDFVDTRLTVTFGDDDLLAPTGAQSPVSPLPAFGDRPGYELFYDNLDSRFTGRENLAHLVVYREMPGFIADVTTEAALVMRLHTGAGLEGARLADSGSYLRVRYNPWLVEPDDGLSITLFPFDSDRMRLGHLYRLSFSGTGFAGGGGLGGLLGFGSSPGLRVGLDRGPGHYFLGLKTVLSTSGDEQEVDLAGGGRARLPVGETQYLALGGASFDLWNDRLRVDLAGGFFQRGTLQVEDYPAENLYAVGGAARLVYHRYMPLIEPIDLQLYRNDPNEPFFAFASTAYVPGQLSYLVSVEGNYLAQRLGDADSPGDVGSPGDATFEHAVGAAARMRIQYDYWRIELTGLRRDVPYLLANAATSTHFMSVPQDAAAKAELFFAVTTDYHLPDPRLTFGLSGGVEWPAAMRVSADFGAGPEDRVLVIHPEGNTTVLAQGEEVSPVIAARADARWDLSEILYARLWVQYVHDANARRIVLMQADGPARTFERSHQLGAGVSLAARF